MLRTLRPGPAAAHLPPVPGRPPPWRRWLRRHRRLIAAGLAAAAVLVAVRTTQPDQAATEAVLVVSHDIAPGALIGPDDVAVARWPVGLAPPDVLRTPDALPGRPVATRLTSGEAVLPARFVSPALVAAYGDGLVATPVRLADAGAAALLREGDLVDVLAAAPGAAGDPGASPARVVAAAVRVVLAGAPSTGSDDALGAAISVSDGSLVVLATSSEAAAAIAGAAATSRLSVVLRAG